MLRPWGNFTSQSPQLLAFRRGITPLLLRMKNMIHGALQFRVIIIFSLIFFNCGMEYNVALHLEKQQIFILQKRDIWQPRPKLLEKERGETR
jgi:hypothetical protein